MKDLKLPKMSEEERLKVWGELKPGDKIVEVRWNLWQGTNYLIWHEVIKRTPKGSIRLKNGELLKEFWDRYHLVTEELLKWYEKVKLEDEVMGLIDKIAPNKREFRKNLEYEDVLKLKKILEKTLNVSKGCD